MSLSSSSTEEACGKKKKPVPQPRSLASKSSSRLQEVQPVPSAYVKVFKRYPSSAGDPPLPSPPLTKTSSSSSSSSSSGEEEIAPALPARQASSRKSHTLSDFVDKE